MTQTVELPGGSVSVLQPRESAELPDAGGVEWAPLSPYWAVMWRSGVALARELDAEELSGCRVLELGCGLGLPALAAARGGAKVFATDSESEPLELLDRNAAENDLEIETSAADWFFPEALIGRGPFDLVLAADVLYFDVAVDALLDLLPRLAPRAMLADPGRPGGTDFVRRAGELWEIETRTRGVVSIHDLRLR